MRRVLLSGAVLVAGLNCGAASAQLSDVDAVEAEDRQSIIRVFGDRYLTEPGSVSILNTDAIGDLSADHPAEVLNTLPGVNTQMNSGQEHLIAVRSPVLIGGAGQGSFLILENGVPTRSPAFGNVNALFEPHHEIADAIEVVRGPGSAKYGSNAVHGLINIIHDGPRALETELRVSGSSLGRYKLDLIGDNGDWGTGALSVQKDVGWRDNTGTVQSKASFVTAFDLGSWDVTPWISASNLEQETAGFLQGADAYQDRDFAKSNPRPEAYRNAWSIRGAARLKRQLNNGTLIITPFVRSQSMEFSQHFLPNGGVEENSHHAVGLMSRYEESIAENLVWRIGGDLDFASGDLKETQLEPFGFFPGDSRFPQGVHYDYTVDTSVGAIWSELSWDVSDRLNVLAGLRAETHNYDYTTAAPVGVNGRFRVPENRTDAFDFVTPKLGAIYKATRDVSLYANYARGSRAPQASDLYRLQSLQGVAEAEVETLDSFEIGGRGSSFDGALVFDVAAYAMDKDKFFFRDANGLNVSDGSTRHRGIEAAFDWSISDAWTVRGNAAWSDQIYTFDRLVGNASEVISDGNEIDTAPEWLADVSLVWTPTDRFEAVLSAEHIGEYFTNPANTRTYPGHTVAHFRTEYALTEAMDGFLIVRNLFDETYADRADFAFGSERYFPGEPLNITFGIRKRFE